MYIDKATEHTIEGITRDEKGEINAYKLESGEIIPKEQAVILAKQGAIKGVSVSVSKYGEEFLRSLPDNNPSNNLENLPVVNSTESYKSRNLNHR